MSDLLPHIAPRDFQPAIWRGYAAGLDQWYWSPATANGRMIEEMLEGQCEAAVVAKVGGTFDDLNAIGRGGEYLDAMKELPSVQDWLNERLGDPGALFGPVPPWLGDAHAARIRWKLICNTPVQGIAA